MKLTNPKNGQSIESPFSSNKEAATALAAKLTAKAQRHEAPSDFENSILEKAQEDKKLSPAQAFWLHKLAMDAPQPQTTAKKRVYVPGQHRRFSGYRQRSTCRCAKPLDEGDGECMYCGYNIR